MATRKNKNKSNDKKGPRQGKRTVFQLQFEDKTTERFLTGQLAKARRLAEANQPEEGIKLLEPLAEKYGGRASILEPLADAYAAAGYLAEARRTLEEALTLAPRTATLSLRFKLAQLYVLTGFNFLAYETSREIDSFELARQVGHPEVAEQCRTFQRECHELVEAVAQANGQSLAEFEPTGLALDRGRLALSRQELTTARQDFQEAIRRDPDLAVAYNNLALVYLLENNLEEALAQTRHVLSEIEPDNRPALSQMVRLLVMAGDRAGAEEYLRRLLALPAPAAPEEIVSLAEAYAALDDDEAVLGLLQPFLLPASAAERQALSELADDYYQEAITFGVVAAANLGQRGVGLRFLREARKFVRPTLLERTLFALENNERGPREAGDFFYYDPVTLYPAAAAYLQDLAAHLDETAAEGEDEDEIPTEEEAFDYRAGLRTFFQKFGPVALEVGAYKYWIDRDPTLVADLLAQALASGVAGASETVRRLAFGRAGDDLQRLTAARVLAEAGQIGSDERIKIWLGQRQLFGTLNQLHEHYRRLAAQTEKTEKAPAYSPAVAARLNEALDAMRRGAAEEAINLYQGILDQDAQVLPALQNLAALTSGRGETERAIGYLQRAARLDPTYLPAQVALAQLWLGSGQLEQARATLERLADNPDLLYVDELEALYTAQATLYQQRGETARLKGILEQLLELDPDNGWAKDRLAELD